MLSITTEALAEAARLLADEMECDSKLYAYNSPDAMILKFTAGHGGTAPFFMFVFSLVFKSVNDVSPSEVYLHATKGPLVVKHDHINVDPSHYTSFADVEASLRALFAAQDNLIKPKPKKLPADALTTTYKEVSDALFERAGMNEDMDVDGAGWMVLSAYSSTDDDRSGINIDLHFIINEDIDTGDANSPSITIVGADREANDHEWEPYSSKNLSVRNVRTMDDLLELVAKNANPKKRKPNA